jgi:hypothetical protein
MGEGEQRRTKRSARFDSRELAQLSRKHTRTEAEWDRDLASGTQPLSTALESRTQTVDDPLTTSLLAEITRRAMTLDVSPRPLEPAEALDGALDEAASNAPDEPDAPAADEPTDHPT